MLGSVFSYRDLTGPCLEPYRRMRSQEFLLVCFLFVSRLLMWLLETQKENTNWKLTQRAH